MGLELHITRAEHWADNDACPITKQEWLAYVNADPELVLKPSAGECYAVWSGTSAYEAPWLDWFEGNISTKWPDSGLYKKMLSIASDLGAHVQDDDGTAYTSAREWQYSPADAEAARALHPHGPGAETAARGKTARVLLLVLSIGLLAAAVYTRQPALIGVCAAFMVFLAWRLDRFLLRPALELVPNRGIGPVLLGAYRAEARDAMRRTGFALERSQEDTDFYCGASLLTECDDAGRISFVEVRPTKRFIATLYGRNVFATPADELFELAASRDCSGEHTFDPHGCTFPHQILVFWQADEQYNPSRPQRYPVWGAIGLGNEAYATAVAELESKA